MTRYRMSFISRAPVLTYSPMSSDYVVGHGHLPITVQGDTPAEAAENAKSWYEAEYATEGGDAPGSIDPANMDSIMISTSGGVIADEDGDQIMEQDDYVLFAAYVFDYATLEEKNTHTTGMSSIEQVINDDGGVHGGEEPEETTEETEGEPQVD